MRQWLTLQVIVLAVSASWTLAACSTAAPPGPWLAPDGGLVVSASGAPLIAGCPLFPPDDDWSRDVSGDPVDPHSGDYLARMNAPSRFLQADFGSDPTYGIPYALVGAGQPRVPMSFLYSSQSEPGPYPLPLDLRVQSGADRHAIAIDRDACLLYETYDTQRDGAGFRCGSGAVFDLRSNKLRPDGWTSATASGLPLFPGLARLEEVQSGEIHHALAFTASITAPAYLHPATHQTGNSNDPYAPPMGLRVRLKASYDRSRFTGAARVVLVALARHGMLLTDVGTDWYVSGSTDARWDDHDLDQLKTVPGAAFEVVQLGTVLR